jgi:hypothetical protein
VPHLLARLVDRLSPARRYERRRIDALSRKLGVSSEDAAAIIGRAREVGFGAAMTEYDASVEARAARDR